MGPPASRKSIHSTKNKGFKKNVLSLKKRAKDIDQVRDEVQKRVRMMEAGEEGAKPAAAVAAEAFDPELPGGGRFYCLETARYFVSQDALDKHKLSKQFKKRCKELEREENYTQESAQNALGVTKEVLPPV